MADATTVSTVETVATPEGGNNQSKSYSEEVVKELIAARDELKRKLRGFEEAQKKAEESKLAEAGKLQELLQAKDKELAELIPLKDELEKFRKEKADQKAELLKKIPKDDRGLFEQSDIPTILKAIELYEQTRGGATEAIRPRTGGEPKDYDSMTEVERLELKASNHSAWAALYSAWYKKKYGTSPPPQYMR